MSRVEVHGYDSPAFSDISRFIANVQDRSKPEPIQLSVELGADRNICTQFFISKRGDKICGSASLTSYTGYHKGKTTSIGLLGNLRFASELTPMQRASAFLAGIRAIKRSIQASEMPLLALVLNSNASALQLFSESRTRGLVCKSLGMYRTFFFPARKTVRTEPNNTEVSVHSAEPDDVAPLIEFLSQERGRYEFAPSYQATDLCPDGACLYGLKLSDIYLAKMDGRIVGSLATWDPSVLRRWFVRGYSPRMRVVRPFYNIVSPLFGLLPLPNANEHIRYRSATLFTVENNVASIFQQLLHTVLDNLARQPEKPCLVMSFSEHDPISPLAKRWSGYVLDGTLFHIQLGRNFHSPSSIIVPYLECGLL